MYDMPLYRPPSEAYSLIIQVTLGCSHNKCNFCSMYKTKRFSIKELDIIKNEIDEFRRMYDNVERIFLADGDALIIPMGKLREILKYINKVFPECNRITMYASPKSIKNKTLNELIELNNLGLKMVYMGIESGSKVVLEEINKGATRDELIDSGKKIKESGILLSVTVIAGIGGKTYSHIHAKDTGSLIGAISPNYLGVLSLMVEENTDIYDDIKEGRFKLLNSIEILKEIKEILININTEEKIIFRSNHASNYVSLKGTLMEDKDRLIYDIDWCIKNHKLAKEKDRRL